MIDPGRPSTSTPIRTRIRTWIRARAGARSRGVSTVVGVALLLLVTVASVAALTAGIGVVVDRGATAASVDRAATDLAALAPADRTGRTRDDVHLGGGSLRTERRTVRVVRVEAATASAAATDPGEVVARFRADALVYESDGRRVAAVAGAVVVGSGESARFRREPRVTAVERVLVGLPVWNASSTTVSSASASTAGGVDTADGAGGTDRATLRMNVRHDRRTFPADGYLLAIETATPAPWLDLLAASGASVDERDLDGDGTPSALARFPGERRLVVVVHDARLGLGVGG